MTDTERRDLDHFMAEKFMGFQRRGPCWYAADGGATGYVWDHIFAGTLPYWSPTTDPRCADAVMARLTELGWWCEVQTPKYEGASHVVAIGRMEEYDPYASFDAPTWPEALCLAVRKAWEEKA